MIALLQQHAIDVFPLDGGPKSARSESFAELLIGRFAMISHKFNVASNMTKINTWNNSKSQ